MSLKNYLFRRLPLPAESSKKLHTHGFYHPPPIAKSFVRTQFTVLRSTSFFTIFSVMYVIFLHTSLKSAQTMWVLVIFVRLQPNPKRLSQRIANCQAIFLVISAVEESCLRTFNLDGRINSPLITYV